MSIVAVHGPNTFGSRGVVDTGPLMGNVNPTNGLKWDFKLDVATTRSNQDFAWTFPPDGTPTPQNVADPSEVTYAAVGAVFGDPTRPTQPTKTAQCVVTNTSKTVTNKALTNNVATLTATTHGFIVGQSVTVTGVDATFNGTFTITTVPTGNTFTYAKEAANVSSTASGGTITSSSTQYPTAGTYTVVVPVATGTAPSLGLQSAPPPDDESAPDDEAGDIPVGYDPAAHSVDEVKEFVTEHPDEVQAIFDTEVAGKNRATLVNWLEENLPFDPGDYTVDEVRAYAEANPDQIEDLIDAEAAGKNRSTLVAHLETMLVETAE